MRQKLEKAKRVFKGVTDISVREGCSLTDADCRGCSDECMCLTLFVKKYHRIIGWFEGERVVKTNPSPSKRYKRKVLGIKKKFWEK